MGAVRSEQELAKQAIPRVAQRAAERPASANAVWRRCVRRPTTWLLGLLSALLVGQYSRVATADGTAPAGPESFRFSPLGQFMPGSSLSKDSGPPENEVVTDSAAEHPWFVEVGVASNFTHLYESHQMLQMFLNGPLAWVPGYDPPREFYDLRREGTLFTEYLAFGRRVNSWVDLAFEFGGGTGRLRSSSEALPLKIRSDLSYSTIIYQFGLRIFPLGRPVAKPDRGLAALLDARPFVYQSFGISDITSSATLGVGLRGMPSILRVRIDQEGWVWAYKLGAGIDIPVHSRVSVGVYGNYSFFLDRSDEFDGFSANVFLKFSL